MENRHIDKAKNLGMIIKKYRKRFNLSQTELADLAGVSLNYVSQLEKGKPKLQLDKLLDILQALGLELTLGSGSSGLKVSQELDQQ